MNPKLFFITGISGSGKTTVARKLTELGEIALDSKIQKGLFHFADKDGNQASDYLPSNKEWSEKYKWRLNKNLFDQLIIENYSAKRIFLCGGADDIVQYWPLGEKVFLLQVDADTMINRLNMTSRDNAFGKDDITQSQLLERLERYQNKKISAGAIPINALRPIEEIVEEILQLAN